MENQDKIIKYPRTPHLQGSRLQPGDEDLSQRPFSDIAGRHVVLEEKIDGANCAISFSQDGELRLQSRGHFLRMLFTVALYAAAAAKKRTHT